MKKRILIIVAILCLIGVRAQAQRFQLLKERTSFIKFDNFNHYFFKSYGGTAFTEFFLSPPTYYDYEEDGGLVYVRDIYRESGITFFRFATDFRLNLIEYYDLLSLSANSPLGVGFTLINEDGMNGILHLPIFLQLNYKGLSTRKAVENNGMYLGFGYHYFSHLIIPKGQRNTYDYFENFGLWTMRFGFVRSKLDVAESLNFNFEYGMVPKRLHYQDSYANSESVLTNFYMTFNFTFKLNYALKSLWM